MGRRLDFLPFPRTARDFTTTTKGTTLASSQTTAYTSNEDMSRNAHVIPPRRAYLTHLLDPLAAPPSQGRLADW